MRYFPRISSCNANLMSDICIGGNRECFAQKTFVIFMKRAKSDTLLIRKKGYLCYAYFRFHYCQTNFHTRINLSLHKGD